MVDYLYWCLFRLIFVICVVVVGSLLALGLAVLLGIYPFSEETIQACQFGVTVVVVCFTLFGPSYDDISR